MANPQDVYNPAPSVEPTVGVPNTYSSLQRQSSGQKGAAYQNLGATLGNLGDKLSALAIQQQGMINETLATNAESKAALEYGDVVTKYRSLEGLSAVSAFPETVGKLKSIKNNILESLPNDASKRAFSQLVLSREASAFQDVHSHSYTQVKAADTNSAKASLDLSVTSASSPSIANDDLRFGQEVGNIKAQIARVIANQGYGPEAGTGMQMTPEGSITFNDTPQGRQAKAVYESFYNKAMSEVWVNRYNTLAFDPKTGNINTAVEKLEADKDKMPADAYTQLSVRLSAPYRAAQARTLADQQWIDTDAQYKEQITAPPSADKLTDVIIQQESGNGATSTNLGQIQPDTWAKYAQPGENANDPNDNRAVTKRILDDYNKRYNGDVARIAVAYFSGPGNVAPEGSPNPWKFNANDKNGKSVASYVSDITGKLNTSVRNYQPQADWLKENFYSLSDGFRSQVSELHPDDPSFVDEATSRYEQRLSGVIRDQELKKSAATNTLMKAIFGGPNGEPTVTSVSQLENGPTPLRDAWIDYQATNPIGAEYIRTKIVSANLRGQALGYGEKFWDYYQDIASGKITQVDQLFPYIGDTKDALLTNTGLTTLGKMITERYTPQGAAFQQQEMAFFNQTRKLITGTGQAPGVVDVNGDTKFNQYMLSVIPQIQALKNSGKTAADLFNKDSPDYVGKDIDKYTRTTSQQFDDVLKSKQVITPAESFGNATFNFKPLDLLQDKDEIAKRLNEAVAAGRLKHEDAMNYYVKRGYARPRVTVPVTK